MNAIAFDMCRSMIVSRENNRYSHVWKIFYLFGFLSLPSGQAMDDVIRGRKTQVLIVEDELVVAREIERTLVSFGYGVVDVVPSGVMAIGVVDQMHPDLVLMDIHLRGGMDGIAAADLIRQGAGVPVVFLTSYFDDDTLDRAIAVEPFGYLLKPFEPQELRMTVETSLARHRAEHRLIASMQNSSCPPIHVGAPPGYVGICASCKKIREEPESPWENVEQFILRYMDAKLTHGICPDCTQRLYPELFGEATPP
jgi:CheY-like chemotaxis protein